MTPGGADQLVCAVDIGTSAVRAALFDGDGVVVESARTQRPGVGSAAQFDAAQLWQDVVTVLSDLESAPKRCAVALAVAAHVGTVLLDGDGEVLHAAGWGEQTGIDELRRLWSDRPEHLQLTGRPAVASSAAALLAGLRAQASESDRRIAKVLTPKDFVLWRLCGSAVTDPTSAAYTLLFDVRARRWAPALSATVGLAESQLPDLRDAAERVGELTEQIAGLTGLPRHLPVCAGGPDGTVGAVALIGTGQGSLADVSGTTDVVVAPVSTSLSSGSRCVLNPYAVAGMWSEGGPTGFTGGAVSHWSRLVGLGDVADIPQDAADALAAIAPGVEGLRLIPYLNGSRLPDWDPTERGSLRGMTADHGPLHIVRAAQEAAAYVVRSAIDALTSVARDAVVVIGGGAARSAQLIQLRADILGRRVKACADPEVTLRGAAMLAALTAGWYADLDSAHGAMGPAVTIVDPDPAVVPQYAEQFDLWQRDRGHLGTEE